LAEADVNLLRFDNETGEGIIGFDPWRTSGPQYEADHNLWYAALTVGGKRIFQYGCPCGTCGITFKKVASPADRVSDAEAADLLGALDHVLSEFALKRLARILPKGTYYLAVIEAPVRLVIPGARDDYFATGVVRLFGLEPLPNTRGLKTQERPTIGLELIMNWQSRTQEERFRLFAIAIRQG
jgi:hypothetical protein